MSESLSDELRIITRSIQADTREFKEFFEGVGAGFAQVYEVSEVDEAGIFGFVRRVQASGMTGAYTLHLASLLPPFESRLNPDSGEEVATSKQLAIYTGFPAFEIGDDPDSIGEQFEDFIESHS